VSGAPQRAPAAAQNPPLRFSALMVDFNPDRAATTVVDIRIERWSTDAEQSTVMTTLAEKGNDELLKVVTKLPRLGLIRPMDALGWDLRYARETRGEDGGREIFIVTDRWISFLERYTSSRSVQYPFTVIQLRMKPNGEGEGTLWLATRLAIARQLLVIDSFEVTDIKLTNVKLQR
jgi:hypothetical protein